MSTAAPASGALRSSLVPHLRGAAITGGLAALGNLVVWGL